MSLVRIVSRLWFLPRPMLLLRRRSLRETIQSLSNKKRGHERPNIWVNLLIKNEEEISILFNSCRSELHTKGWYYKSLICGRHSSVVSSAPTILRPGFESQAHHLSFFQFVLLKLYRENNENKQKEAGIGPFFLKRNL